MSICTLKGPVLGNGRPKTRRHGAGTLKSSICELSISFHKLIVKIFQHVSSRTSIEQGHTCFAPHRDSPAQSRRGPRTYRESRRSCAPTPAPLRAHAHDTSMRRVPALPPPTGYAPPQSLRLPSTCYRTASDRAQSR